MSNILMFMCFNVLHVLKSHVYFLLRNQIKALPASDLVSVHLQALHIWYPSNLQCRYIRNMQLTLLLELRSLYKFPRSDTA